MTEYDRTHLNYWIPLVKPSRTEAGMHLIPWDRLGEKSPRLFNLCRRSGASSLHSLRDGGTLYISDWSGVHWVEENLEVEDVMETAIWRNWTPPIRRIALSDGLRQGYVRTAWSKGLWERVVVEIGRLLVDALFDPRMTAA